MHNSPSLVLTAPSSSFAHISLWFSITLAHSRCHLLQSRGTPACLKGCCQTGESAPLMPLPSLFLIVIAWLMSPVSFLSLPQFPALFFPSHSLVPYRSLIPPHMSYPLRCCRSFLAPMRPAVIKMQQLAPLVHLHLTSSPYRPFPPSPSPSRLDSKDGSAQAYHLFAAHIPRGRNLPL